MKGVQVEERSPISMAWGIEMSAKVFPLLPVGGAVMALTLELGCSKPVSAHGPNRLHHSSFPRSCNASCRPQSGDQACTPIIRLLWVRLTIDWVGPLNLEGHIWSS